jgi:hypothetical protein
MRDDREIPEHHAEAVVEGDWNANAIGAGITERLPDEEAVVEDVVVRERRALRESGRPRGVLNVDRLIEVELGLASTKISEADSVAFRQ